MAQDPRLRRAARDRHLRGMPLAVYIHLVAEGVVGPEYQPLKITGIALVLRTKRQTVARALGTLTDRGYIERGANDGALHTFRLPNHSGE